MIGYCDRILSWANIALRRLTLTGGREERFLAATLVSFEYEPFTTFRKLVTLGKTGFERFFQCCAKLIE